MIWVFIGCYAVLAASLIVPFRVSSAESRREEEELASKFGVCKTIYPPIYTEESPIITKASPASMGIYNKEEVRR